MSDIFATVCEAVADDRPLVAATILAEEYPFVPLQNVGRRYSAVQSMRVFVRDGFIDRYTGKRLFFPGTLRLISRLLPQQFPFHPNWKTDACHFGFYELFPTIDHLLPVSRGGLDDAGNWVSTSMLKNAAKANFTVEELPKIVAFSEWLLAEAAEDRRQLDRLISKPRPTARPRR